MWEAEKYERSQLPLDGESVFHSIPGGQEQSDQRKEQQDGHNNRATAISLSGEQIIPVLDGQRNKDVGSQENC